jgi:hypothetical protein
MGWQDAPEVGVTSKKSAWMDAPEVDAKPAAPLPINEMSFGQNLAAGAGKFVSDTGIGIGQLVNDAAAGLERAAPSTVRKGIDWLNEKMGSPSAEAIQARGRADIEETRKRDAPLMNTAGGKTGYFLGGASTIPFMPALTTVKGAAALGAGLGSAQPATSWEERRTNAGIGALAGGAGQAGVNALSRVIQPKTSPNIKALMNDGVTPTPGQILGGAWQRAEEGLTSLPIAGDAIKAGQRRAMEDVNRAAFNRALKPIGETLPPKMMGREAVEHVYGKLGDAYSALLPKMSTQADGQFAQEISSLKNMVGTGSIDPKSAAAFERILQNDVLGKFQGQQSITGQTLKQIEGDLTEQIKRFGISTDADQRLVGDALKEVQSTLRGLVQRTNPQHAAELKSINEGYANFKRVQRAAAGLGAEDGVFSPAQLQSAVKALDRSKDKARFSEGSALMQDLSESAKTALGNKVPDSGTPYRMATALGASGGAATFLGGPAGAAVIAAPVMYSKQGQALLAAMLAKRPQGAKTLADLARTTGPYVGGGSAALATQR